MWRFAAALAMLFVGCAQRSRPAPRASDGSVDVVYVPPDAPPPSVDAAPAPMPACTVDAGANACPLPPSTCLDANYLVYYTGGNCVDGTCQFTTNVMYCGPAGCVNGGCLGGFT